MVDVKESAMEEIIKKFGAYIYNFALKLTCHPADAEDLVQETFISAWAHLNDIREEAAMKGWLRSICLNQFRMNMRKQKKLELNFTDGLEALETDGQYFREYVPLPEDEVVVEEAIKELQNGCFMAMVRRLTLNQRIAFSLIDMFGMDIEAVAGILKVSQPAVKGLLYRARMSLESFFAGHCNLLDEKNPCSCRAWIEFSKNRDKLQEELKDKLEVLDYRNKNYQSDPGVRNRILYLYKIMPDKKPPQEWYENIILAVAGYH